jgi:hypothetical protein
MNILNEILENPDSNISTGIVGDQYYVMLGEMSVEYVAGYGDTLHNAAVDFIKNLHSIPNVDGLDPKLDWLVDDMAYRMKQRLVEKQKQGYTEWEIMGMGSLLNSASVAFDKVRAGMENEIDVACWLAFIFNVHNNK